MVGPPPKVKVEKNFPDHSHDWVLDLLLNLIVEQSENYERLNPQGNQKCTFDDTNHRLSNCKYKYYECNSWVKYKMYNIEEKFSSPDKKYDWKIYIKLWCYRMYSALIYMDRQRIQVSKSSFHCNIRKKHSSINYYKLSCNTHSTWRL